MKYIITENKLDNIVFKYLDLNLRDLEKKESKYYDGFVLTYPDKTDGILGWRDDGTLYVYTELFDEILSTFGLEYSDTKYVIARWFRDRYELEVINIYNDRGESIYLIAIDTN
jgi:hypothetical protein